MVDSGEEFVQAGGSLVSFAAAITPDARVHVRYNNVLG